MVESSDVLNIQTIFEVCFKKNQQQKECVAHFFEEIKSIKKKSIQNDQVVKQFVGLIDKHQGNQSAKAIIEECMIVFLNEHYRLNPVIETALFFPSEQNEFKLIDYLKKAKKSLDVCVFTITNNHLANELYIHHAKGVKVRIISDDEQAKSLGADVNDLAKAGLEVRTDDDPKAHMHNKFIIIDDYVLINGSFNWTVNAVAANKENLTIQQNEPLVKLYKTEFERLWKEFEKNKIKEEQHLPQRFKNLKIH